MSSCTPTTSQTSMVTPVKSLKKAARHSLAGQVRSSGEQGTSDFKSGKHVCFTLHVRKITATGATETAAATSEEWKPDKDCVEKAINLVWTTIVPLCSRACFGLEKGAQGRWHGQGFASFVKAKKLSQLRKLERDSNAFLTGPDGPIGLTLSFIRARGTPKQNLDYCTKDSNRHWIHGEFPESHDQGKRTDLAAVLDFCEKNGLEANAEWDLMKEHAETFFRHPKACQRALLLGRKLARRRIGYSKPKVYLYYGDEGTGKSRKADYEATRIAGDSIKVYRQPPGKWWPGLDGERHIILDDFRDEWCTPSTLLQWLDGYPFTTEDKGTHVVPFFTHIWITSNEPIEEWWSEARAKKPRSATWGAIRRRFDHIEHFTKSMFPEPWRPPVDSSTKGKEAATQEDSEQDGDPSELITANQEGMDWDLLNE
jgi:hypothetical protein